MDEFPLAIIKEELRRLEAANGVLVSTLQGVGQRASAAFAIYSALLTLSIGAGLPKLLDLFQRAPRDQRLTVYGLVWIALFCLILAGASLLRALPPSGVRTAIPSADYSATLQRKVPEEVLASPTLRTIYLLRSSISDVRKVIEENERELARVNDILRFAVGAMTVSLSSSLGLIGLAVFERLLR